MSQLLLLGCCPLPGEKGCVAAGPGLRAWQFLKPLRAAGHDVRFMALRNESDYRHEVPPVVRRHLDDGFAYDALNVEFFSDAKLLIARQDAWKPDAVLGVGSILPAQMAVLAASVASCPAWADLFGDPLAELQATAALQARAALQAAAALQAGAALQTRAPSQGVAEKTDRDRIHAGLMMMRVLARADRLSTVSRRQEEAVLGQLGLVGRLNQHTVGCRLTSVVPCGIDLDAALPPVPQKQRPAGGAPSEFRLCLSGSFNTWMDGETLAKGLEKAMKHCERLRLAVTGGATPGYSEGLYEAFIAAMKQAGLERRCVLHGWLPNEAVAAVHSQCDAGLNVDRWTVEGVFGSRNRVIQWLHLGLPVITPVLTELTEALAAVGGVIPFRIGDADSLC